MLEGVVVVIENNHPSVGIRGLLLQPLQHGLPPWGSAAEDGRLHLATGCFGLPSLGYCPGYTCPDIFFETMLITVGWAALAAVFSFSIAMVVWGRNGDGTLNF